MRDIPFVDAHVHLWDLKRISYPWLTPPFSDDGPNGSVEPIAADYLLDDYLADAENWNVVGMVHVDAGADAAAALDETGWLQQMADVRGLPNGIVAFAALDDPGVEALLEAQAAHPNVRGIRHIINWHPDPRCTYTQRDVTRDEAWQRGFGLLANYGLSFDLQCYPNQFTAMSELIARHPDTIVILNHSGMAVPTDADGWEAWRRGMRMLAEHPNVHVKVSGMGFAKRDWGIAFARPYVLETIEIFGAERAMLASDFPTDKLFGTFDHTLGAYAEIVSGFADDERRALFGRNANRIYRLGLEL
jgi:predicted TIM-barrel fold metal-dependent hydrolase